MEHRQAERTWIQESHGPRGLPSEWRKVKTPGWGRGTEWCWAKPHAGEAGGEEPLLWTREHPEVPVIQTSECPMPGVPGGDGGGAAER